MRQSLRRKENRRGENIKVVWFRFRKKEIKKKYKSVNYIFITIIIPYYNGTCFLKSFKDSKLLMVFQELIKVNDKGTGQKIELHRRCGTDQRSSNEMVTCGN